MDERSGRAGSRGLSRRSGPSGRPFRHAAPRRSTTPSSTSSSTSCRQNDSPHPTDEAQGEHEAHDCASDLVSHHGRQPSRLLAKYKTPVRRFPMIPLSDGKAIIISSVGDNHLCTGHMRLRKESHSLYGHKGTRRLRGRSRRSFQGFTFPNVF